MEILVHNLSTDLTASILDDHKVDAKFMTYEGKLQELTTVVLYSQMSIENLFKFNLSTTQLKTIALACQPLLLVQVIDLGLTEQREQGR